MPSRNRKRKSIFKLGSLIDQRKNEFVKLTTERVKKEVFCSYITSKALAQES